MWVDLNPGIHFPSLTYLPQKGCIQILHLVVYEVLLKMDGSSKGLNVFISYNFLRPQVDIFILGINSIIPCGL